MEQAAVAAPDSAARDNKVDVEKLRLVYSAAPTPIIALIVGAAIVAGVIFIETGQTWVITWFLVHLLLTAGRLVLLRVFQSREQLPRHFRAWATVYTLSLGCIGLMWGWVALQFDIGWPLSVQLIVLIFLVGICAAGGLSHAFYIQAYMALLIPILVPLAWRMLSIPQTSYMLLGSGVIVFSVYMAIIARRYSTTTTQFLELRFRNQDLVENLSRVNQNLQNEVGEHTRALEALAGRSRVLELLARGDSLNQVLDLLLASMEQVLPGTRAMIMRLDDDRQNALFVAGPNLPRHFVDALEQAQADDAMEPAVRRQRVIVDDIRKTTTDPGMLELLRGQGIRGSWSEPILSANGTLLGTLRVYLRGVRANDRFEADFIQTTAQLAGIAIERKDTEAVLEQSRRHLEERVEARTRELRLVLKEVESFNYSVSHDLRGPLRAIDGYSQVLLEDYADDLPPAAHDLLARCRSASQRMGQLIDGLLKISRLSRKDLERSWVNYSNVCERIAESLAAAEPHRQIHWHIRGGITLWGDPTLLELVAENLMSNACKFTRNVAVAQIEVGAEDTGNGIKVWIRDNGAGFDMAYANKLFNPFQRLHDEKQFAGTGIGLATVERIIKRHDGRIWAQSALDEGARFTFSLPQTDAPPQYSLLARDAR